MAFRKQFVLKLVPGLASAASVPDQVTHELNLPAFRVRRARRPGRQQDSRARDFPGRLAIAVLSFLAGLAPGTVGHQLRVTSLAGALAELTWFTAIAWLVGRLVRGAGRRAARVVITEQARDDGPRDGHAGMAVHYEILHDTVLSTLTAIARGGLDHRSSEVRARCAREAEYLRRLISGEAEDEPDRRGLHHALSEVCREAEQFGMRVRCFTDSLPVLPAPVVTAMSRAAREALNNARLHAGTGKGWVTAVGEGGAVTVTITDRGRGFDQPAAGLQAAGLAAADLPAAGFPAAGFPAAGLQAAGPPAAGFPAAGLQAAGFPAAGLQAAGPPAAGLPAAGPPAAGLQAAGRHPVPPDGLAAARPGLGIRRSIMQRMADAGGSATVTSAVGIGTRVELRWPAT